MTDAVDPARLRELGDFLRSRRDRLRPADVGLPPGARRRTPGLRREEVATLAAISPTYLAFLEQGRDVRPSRQVLDALAGALRLGAAERAHLPEARNMLWWMFTDPAARTVFAEWEQEASAPLARFRSAAARHQGDPGFEELAARLTAASPEVRAWWPRHDIPPLSSGTKRLRHPVLGELELRHVVLLTADDVEQKLVAFLASDADQARIAELITTG
ncbi:helix-turn-helix transcriptional regulator [Microbispora hainanensis]|uniref:Helix-turn-helix domain-containing protein n=1 Tax=Microbispora hainanensis TaxID=568844 RepID=A0A544YA87_9ACTN|nr:helix-turn-helix transcriptional regulator [Microbispora hainanensis]TQS13644.1 helix-turn-helix domain-containing protein [Microbispora hainanensis]